MTNCHLHSCSSYILFLFTMLLIVYVKIKLCWNFLLFFSYIFRFSYSDFYVTCFFSPVTSHFYTFSYLYTFFLFVRHEIFIYNSKIVPKIIYYKENGNEIFMSATLPVKQVHTFYYTFFLLFFFEIIYNNYMFSIAFQQNVYMF